MTKAPRLTRLALAVAVVPCALLIAGCGESEQEKFEKAKAEVCKSRSAIEKQVETLRSLPVSPTSIESAKKGFEAISKELKKISEEAPKLKPETKSQVESATTQFKSEISSLASSLTSASLNPASAKTQAEAATKKLVTSYETTLKKLSCT
jgi:hypothetical protein